MIHPSHGLGAFGVCLLAALGLMAATAAGAQAAEEWLIEGVRAPDPTPIHAAIHPLKDTGKRHIVFLTTVLNQPIEILCSELTTDDGLLIQNTLILILLLFANCETFIKGVVAKACKPQEPLHWGLLGHLFLHGEPKKLTYILFENDKETKFSIKFGAECALGASLPITGTWVAECLSEKLQKKEETGIDYCLEELVHHLIQQAPEKLFEKDILKIGNNVALVDGILDLLLSESNERWSGHV